MHITQRRTDVILKALQQQDVEYCSAYGEPGYSDPEKGILFGNWNRISRRVQDYLEEAGYELQWSDEWYIDYDNDKAWRTSPDSYGWQCQIAYTDNGVLTPDDDITEWVQYAVDNPRFALPSHIEPSELESLGFERVGERYENGFHYGQNDDPHTIYKQFKDRGEVLFRLTGVGQFDIHFECYVRKTAPDSDEFTDLLEEVVDRYSAEYLLSVPGVYEALSEHFNNDVIDLWEERRGTAK